MPLTFSSVRSVEGAIATGIMRSAYWVFAQLSQPRARREFIQQRFPSLNFGQQTALLNRMEASYSQGAAATGDPGSARLGQMQFDPTHTSQGRLAYNVEIQARATGGEVDEFGRPGVRTRLITIYSNEILTEEELQQRINQSAEQTFRDEYGRELSRGEVTLTGLDYQIINITRSY